MLRLSVTYYTLVSRVLLIFMKRLITKVGILLLLLSSSSNLSYSETNWHKIYSTDNKFTVQFPIVPKSQVKKSTSGLKENLNYIIHNHSLYQFIYTQFRGSPKTKLVQDILPKLAKGNTSAFDNGELISSKAIKKKGVPCQKFLVKGIPTSKMKEDLQESGFDIANAQVTYWQGTICIFESYYAEASIVSLTPPGKNQDGHKFLDSFTPNL